MSEIVVFCGPTIDAVTARRHLDATYLPPAAAGDLYCAAARRPLAIGLIDGLFNTRASVFHKEILWAMRQGIHVYGSSSMGALRAAELGQFGMIGVGRVFAEFDGDGLTDDDEVAVAHLSAEDRWACTSDAMVNLRATVAASVAAGVITSSTARALLALAKRRFYPERSVDSMIRDGVAEGLPDVELAALKDCLAMNGVVDQKRIDALELLGALAELRRDDPGPKQVDYPFDETVFWQVFRSELDDRISAESAGVTTDVAALLDELRLDVSWPVIRGAALSQALAQRLAERLAVSFDAKGLSEAATEVFVDKGLTSMSELHTWIDRQRLDEVRVRELIHGEAKRRWGERHVRLAVENALLTQLQLSDDYPRIRVRAEHKRRELSARGLMDLPNPIGMTEPKLWSWWESYDEDFAAYPSVALRAKRLGFANEALFRTAVINEYHYRTRCHPAGEAAEVERAGPLRDDDIITEDVVR